MPLAHRRRAAALVLLLGAFQACSFEQYKRETDAAKGSR